MSSTRTGGGRPTSQRRCMPLTLRVTESNMYAQRPTHSRALAAYCGPLVRSPVAEPECLQYLLPISSQSQRRLAVTHGHWRSIRARRDLLRIALYQVVSPGREPICRAPPVGIEPTTCGLGNRRSKQTFAQLRTPSRAVGARLIPQPSQRCRSLAVTSVRVDRR